MITRILLLLVVGLFFFSGKATDFYPKSKSIDVIHYHFYLEVNDSTDAIYGEATVSILFKKSSSSFELDLASKNELGKGMEAVEVLLNDISLDFSHNNDKLTINLSTPTKENETLDLTIKYNGIPQDGLIIGKNKFGDRGFFGDNWPDRAHQWLPVVDHPSDKASVDFTVSAPLH